MADPLHYAADDSARTDARLRGIAAVAGLALAIALIAVLFLIDRANHRRDVAIAAERHSYDVMVLTQGISGAIGRSEAALGRFVIASDKKVGTTYYYEWVAGARQVDQLSRLVAPDPAQRARVAKLAELYQARGRELATPAANANYKRYLSALKTYHELRKSKTMPALARQIADMETAERATLATRSAEARAAAADADLLVSVLSAFGIAVAALAVTLGWLTVAAMAEYRRARATADQESDRAGWLEMAVAERTAALSEANRLLQAEMVERESAEMQLRQVQKMEAVGQLTGGIAHDFNNMLAVVLGGLDLAKRRLKQETDEVGRHIDNAMEGANRAATLTRRLLSFARAEPLLPQAVDPGALIAGMSDLLDRTLGERIVVTTRGLEGLWRVWVDGHQLENAILNLAVNARDAMDGAGRVLIGGANVTLARHEVGEAEAGDYVCISVVDDGCGMSREVAERVFEPFFTTKPVGKGTGLGLSQIFGFVRQSDGEIAIDSIEQAGTVVSLYLPRHLGRVAAPPVAAPVEPLPRRMADAGAVQADAEPMILVVEDDVRVLRATLDGLAELGLPAVSASGGEEALARLAAMPSIRLLVTDVVMPGMTGPELVRRAGQLYPDLLILFVTGYVGEAGEAGDLAGYEILRKPFTIAALERAVAAVLPPDGAGFNAPRRRAGGGAAG